MSKTVKGHFLTDEQKKVKQEVMINLFECMDKIMNYKWDLQALTDISLSCIIMFNRDFLYSFIIQSSVNSSPKEFLDGIFDTIKSEILIKLSADSKA